MRKKLWHKMIAILLVGATICSMAACGGMGIGGHKLAAIDLMQSVRNTDETWTQEGYNPAPVQTKVTDFAVRLFQKSLEDEKNTLISPISVLMALGMTANGAKENTLAQMEETFGLSQAEVNEYLWYYMHALSKDNVKYTHTQNGSAVLRVGVCFIHVC